MTATGTTKPKRDSHMTIGSRPTIPSTAKMRTAGASTTMPSAIAGKIRPALGLRPAAMPEATA